MILIGPNCTDSAIQTIEILVPVPVAEFEGPASGCKPLSVQFTNNSLYGDTYLWDFGDGGFSTQFEPNYTFYTAGVYTVSLTVVGQGGQDIETKQFIIEVYETPNAFFSVTPTKVFIPNEPIFLFNLSTFASSYLWDFGDGNSSTE